MEQALSTVTIPDVSGSASVPVVGSVDYDLTKYINYITMHKPLRGFSDICTSFKEEINFSLYSLLPLSINLFNGMFCSLNYKISFLFYIKHSPSKFKHCFFCHQEWNLWIVCSSIRYFTQWKCQLALQGTRLVSMSYNNYIQSNRNTTKYSNTTNTKYSNTT